MAVRSGSCQLSDPVLGPLYCLKSSANQKPEANIAWQNAKSERIQCSLFQTDHDRPLLPSMSLRTSRSANEVGYSRLPLTVGRLPQDGPPHRNGELHCKNQQEETTRLHWTLRKCTWGSRNIIQHAKLSCENTTFSCGKGRSVKQTCQVN